MAENKQNWQYDKLQEDGKIKTISDFQNDPDGKITGHIVMNVKAWFDENPEERIRRGWTKHILHDTKEVEYNKQTQFLAKSVRQVDEYTIEDEFFVLDKSEEQLAFEEMLTVANGGEFGISFIGGDF